jgi:hypothetical protein
MQKFRNRKYNFIPNGPLVPVRVTNRDQRSSSRSTCPGPRGGPLVPVRKQPGLKTGAFSPALLVPVATTRTNGLYKPGLKAFFPPVSVLPFFLRDKTSSFASIDAHSQRDLSQLMCPVCIFIFII